MAAAWWVAASWPAADEAMHKIAHPTQPTGILKTPNLLEDVSTK